MCSIEIGINVQAKDVREAFEAGVEVDVCLVESALGDGYAIGASYILDGGRYLSSGKRFTSSDPAEAQKEFIRKKERLLTGKTPRATRYSQDYKVAKEALEERIRIVLEQAQTGDGNVLMTTRITIDKRRGEPKLKVSRMTTPEELEAKYSPEFVNYMTAFRKEMGN